MKKLLMVSFLLILLSCGKDKLIDEASSMVGIWTHYTSETAWETLIINEDGTGKVEWFTNSKLHKETKVKDWFVKDNKLYLGKVTFSLSPYDIDQYPLTSGNEEINGFDTLGVGERYVQLDQLYFVEKG